MGVATGCEAAHVHASEGCSRRGAVHRERLVPAAAQVAAAIALGSSATPNNDDVRVQRGRDGHVAGRLGCSGAACQMLESGAAQLSAQLCEVRLGRWGPRHGCPRREPPTHNPSEYTLGARRESHRPEKHGCVRGPSVGRRCVAAALQQRSKERE